MASLLDEYPFNYPIIMVPEDRDEYEPLDRNNLYKVLVHSNENNKKLRFEHLLTKTWKIAIILVERGGGPVQVREAGGPAGGGGGGGGGPGPPG